jgi:nucleoside-diphosphate-sugar epimerase
MKSVLITGGAGFIGTNLARRFLSSGHPVLLYDNLSRPRVRRNLEWLQLTHDDLVRIETGDVRDPAALRKASKCASKVFHFAAQVTVTSSLIEPIHDFEVNARGTLNLLEALRGLENPPPLLFTCTNQAPTVPDLEKGSVKRNGNGSGSHVVMENGHERGTRPLRRLYKSNATISKCAEKEKPLPALDR